MLVYCIVERPKAVRKTEIKIIIITRSCVQVYRYNTVISIGIQSDRYEET